MTLIARPPLAEAAQRELAIREQLWPREVYHQRATQGEADADLAAWRDLCAWTEAKAPERARALQLHAVLVEAEARRWAGKVEEDHPRYRERAQRILDTAALSHAFDLWLIRRGWMNAADRPLPGFDEAA